MDDRTGDIYTREQVDGIKQFESVTFEDAQEEMKKKFASAHLKPMKIDPTPRQLKTGKVGRNDACPCGSGMKFKRCCLFVKVTA